MAFLLVTFIVLYYIGRSLDGFRGPTTSSSYGSERDIVFSVFAYGIPSLCIWYPRRWLFILGIAVLLLPILIGLIALIASPLPGIGILLPIIAWLVYCLNQLSRKRNA